MRHPVVVRVIEKVGSASALARQLGIKPAAVIQWDHIPFLRVPEVERITGIPRHELRPDLWEAPAQATAS